jgi:hypothetical protein
MTISAITSEDLKQYCNRCRVGYDPLHKECYECSHAPGRKDNFKQTRESARLAEEHERFLNDLYKE